MGGCLKKPLSLPIHFIFCSLVSDNCSALSSLYFLVLLLVIVDQYWLNLSLGVGGACHLTKSVFHLT